jgi:hypothetical protein
MEHFYQFLWAENFFCKLASTIHTATIISPYNDELEFNALMDLLSQKYAADI